MKYVGVLLLGFLAVSSTAPSPHNKKCPNPTATANVDWKKMVGDWYEVEYSNKLYSEWVKCVHGNLTMDRDGELHSVTRYLVKGKEYFYNGVITVDPTTSGKVNFKVGNFSFPVWYLAVDADNFSLAYSCLNTTPDFGYEFAIISSRTDTLPQETLDKLQDVLKSQGVDLSMFKIDQSKCPKE